MKATFFLSIIVSTLGCAQEALNQSSIDPQFKKIDSAFQNHFMVLDTYISDTTSDPSGRRMESIHFMERATGINATGDYTFIGKDAFTKKNLESWHNYFNENRDKLVWDNKTKTVRRRDD